MKRYPLGVIGAGKMGMAIAQGAVRANLWHKEDILLCNRSAQAQQAHAAQGFAVTGDFADVYRQCDRVILGVKPQGFAALLDGLKNIQCAPKPLLISIAAGVPFAKMEQALGADTPIVRVMPNTPLLLGAGTTTLMKNPAASDAQFGEVQALFDSMGVTIALNEEDMLNEVIPYSGSLPAFVYQFINAFLKSAEAHGLTQAQAMPMICSAVIGSAKMVMAGEKAPEELISDVCSPGGTTIQGVTVFDEAGLDKIVANACDKTIARAYELGKAD